MGITDTATWRAIYKDGWKAVTIHGNRMPWILASTSDFKDDVWELYHIDEDFSESHNVADQYPEKLEELKARWVKSRVVSGLDARTYT